MPFFEILCPRTIPSVTMKLHFSQFKTRLVSTHLLGAASRLFRQSSKLFPNTEKSSMNTSMDFSTMSKNIANMHLWKVVGALHRPNDILL
ncbi:hypothetical protein QL285_081815 [Trifolium repens]|nr:hypothetical protein QL285_081815 [Trifolium repens]